MYFCPMQGDYALITKKLRAFVKKYYQNKLIRGLILCVGIVSMGFISFATLEHFGNFGTEPRAFIFWLFLASSLTLFAFFVLSPAFRLLKLSKQLTDAEAAELIGKHFPEVDDKLQNVLQLKTQRSSNTGLLEASIKQKAAALRPIPFLKAVDFFENKRFVKYLTVPAVVVLSLYLSGRETILTESTARIIDYQTEYIPPNPFQITVLNEVLECIQHQDFLFRIQFTGEAIPVDAFLELKGLPIKMRRMPNHTFEYRFRNLQKNQNFTIKAGERFSRQYLVNVFPAPSLVNFELTLDYPSYTERRDEVIANVGGVTVPEGTWMRWDLTTENTDSIESVWGLQHQNLKKNSPNKFSFLRKANQSLRYTFLPFNKQVATKDSVSYNLKVVKDAYPFVDATQSLDSALLRLRYFNGQVSDDYGLEKLQFVIRRQNHPRDSIIPIEINKNLKQSNFFFVLDLLSVDFSEDELIEYHFEVFDNDEINGSKKSKSKTFEFQAPTTDEIKSAYEEKSESLKEQLGENVELAKELQKDFRDLKKKLLQKEELSWEDKQMFNEVLEKQKKLEKNIEQISLRNKEKNTLMKEFTEQDKRILEKQNQLEELMDELMSDEMRALFNEMDQLMEEMNSEEWMEKLEDLQMSNEDLEKELDRNLEMLKKFEFDQALDNAVDQMQIIKEEQAALNKATNERTEDFLDIAEKQKKINDSFKKLSEELEALREQNDALENKENLSDTKDLEQRVQEKQQESLENLTKDKLKKAAQSQKESLELIEMMLSKLKDAQGGGDESSPPEDMAVLRQILENLIDLSLEEEALLVDLSETQKNDPNYVSIIHWQNKLSDDSKVLEDSLYALSRRQSQIKATVNREINAISENIKKSLDHMSERETKKALTRQQLVMTSANNLALMLTDILHAMQQDAGQGMPGDQQCNKPGPTKPSPGDLKKMQESLKQQLEQMKNGKQDFSGQKPNGSRSKALAKMMRRQEMIRHQLEKMADKMEGAENKSLEGLRDAILQMEKTEGDLSDNNITQGTIDRQNEIIQKLLESDLAEQERGKEEEREAKEAKQLPHHVKNLLEEYQKNKLKQAEFLKTMPPELKPYFKEKVNEYFQKLDED
jgi:hypothetical protein